MIVSLRHRALRAALSLVALGTFLGASAADARGLDPCPHHDALNLARYGGAAGPRDGHTPAHDMAHMDHAAHMAHGDHSAHATQKSSDESSDKAHEHGPCNCVGSCDAGGSPPLVAYVPDVVATLAPVTELSAAAVAQNLVPGHDDGWTPYLPQAPPFPV